MTLHDSPTPDNELPYPRESPRTISFNERTAIHLCWLLDDVLTHTPSDSLLNPAWQYRRAITQLQNEHALHGTCTRAVHLLITQWGRWEPQWNGILRLVDLFEQALADEENPQTDSNLRYNPREKWY